MKVKYKIELSLIILITFTIIAIFFILTNISKPKYDDLILTNFHSTDAKLGFKGNIITSKDGQLYIINTIKQDINETQIRSNWVDALIEEDLIVYSNQYNEVGVCRYDANNASILNNINILENDEFRIDPSIAKHEQYYYLTLTTIVGNVNRSDPNIENGLYSVNLYRSTDLSNWEFINQIVQKKNNIEDVELYFYDQTLFLVYEEEVIDKGPSRIKLKESTDLGLTWSEEIVLIDNSADNEPASFYKNNDQYWLFYSSDINHPGESYEGGEAFLTSFTPDFQIIETNQIKATYNSQMLLYEALVINNKLTILYSNDYLGSNDLCLENFSI